MALMRPMLPSLLCVDLAMGRGIPRSAAGDPSGVDLIAGSPAGPWRRLFLDAMVVEQQEGLQRVSHAARTYEGNPVVRRDQPWELAERCTGPYLYTGVTVGHPGYKGMAAIAGALPKARVAGADDQGAKGGV